MPFAAQSMSSNKGKTPCLEPRRCQNVTRFNPEGFAFWNYGIGRSLPRYCVSVRRNPPKLVTDGIHLNVRLVRRWQARGFEISTQCLILSRVATGTGGFA